MCGCRGRPGARAWQVPVSKYEVRTPNIPLLSLQTLELTEWKRVEESGREEKRVEESGREWKWVEAEILQSWLSVLKMLVAKLLVIGMLV